MSALTPELAALLAAIRDAIDLPMSHWAEADERAHHQLLIERAAVARIILSGVLDNGHDIPTVTDWLSKRTAGLPVTYTVWVPRGSEEGQS